MSDNNQSIFCNIRKIMSNILSALEEKINQIHIGAGITEAQVTDAVNKAVEEATTGLQGQINDLAKALSDTLDHINAGNVDVAAATLVAAADAVKPVETVAVSE